MDYTRHFSGGVSDEGQLRAIDLEEEIRFRFRKNLVFTLKRTGAGCLQKHPVLAPPNRQLCSPAKNIVRRKFVLAGTGIAEFRFQFDEDMWFGHFGGKWGKMHLKKEAATDDNRHGDVALKPGATAGSQPAED